MTNFCDSFRFFRENMLKTSVLGGMEAELRFSVPGLVDFTAMHGFYSTVKFKQNLVLSTKDQAHLGAVDHRGSRKDKGSTKGTKIGWGLLYREDAYAELQGAIPLSYAR
ncbi:hypothetical protein [Candidatus Methylospira mobilis]|uniref:hypothetical protein n=1 Tax=Candidatus Methylospira mobilis TaxID=1808979 RepID=UPI001884F198|nr:hypothetical protein [Candidatus Methylospira mobilis]